MKAIDATIAKIFNNDTLLEVPFFQRSYVWGEDLWQRLLDDLAFISAHDMPHFLGSIILKEGAAPAKGDLFSERWTIVDGQQRLTTLLIFFRVLCLKTKQLPMFDMQFRLMGSDKLALSLGRDDVAPFARVMAATTVAELDNSMPVTATDHAICFAISPANISVIDPAIVSASSQSIRSAVVSTIATVSDSSSKIIDAFNFFIKKLDATKFDFLLIRKNMQFVRIDLDKDEDEQQIFDTINSLGVDLTTAELLKNYFFNRDSIDDYESQWVPVFEKDDETKLYWRKQVVFAGQGSRTMMDIFLATFFQLLLQDGDYGVTSEDKQMYNHMSHLSRAYRHFINKYCGGNKGAVLDLLCDYALCFRITFNVDYCEQSVPAAFGIERLNVVIFGLKHSSLIPYVLYVAKKAKASEKNAIYGMLESYIMRRMIARATGKNYSYVFLSLVADCVLAAEELRSRLHGTGVDGLVSHVPDDAALQYGFANSKLVDFQAKCVLYLLESSMRNAADTLSLKGFNHYSIEHLMPRQWHSNWPACASEDLRLKRNGVILTLGNLTLLTQALNTAVRNSAWAVKKQGYQSQYGQQCQQGQQGHEGEASREGLVQRAGGLHILEDALKKDKWDEEEIAARAQWLYEQARELWQL